MLNDTHCIPQVQGCINSDAKAVYVSANEVYNRRCSDGARCRHEWPAKVPIWDKGSAEDECDAPLPYGWSLLHNRVVWPHSYNAAKHFSTFEKPYLNLVSELRCWWILRHTGIPAARAPAEAYGQQVLADACHSWVAGPLALAAVYQLPFPTHLQ